uniref:Integrase core domain containing protein n=1 Tax=Solanum tuberosum TaxID=4113 RepID=M1DVY5_SOLTU
MTLVDDMVLIALFEDGMQPPDSSRTVGKRPYSSHTSDGSEAGRGRKRELQETEAARRASIVDEELRQQRARRIGVGASSSVMTIDGAVRVNVSTTEGAEMVDAGTRLLRGLRRNARHIFFTYPLCFYSLCIGDNCTLFFGGWGKWIVSDRVKFE